MNAYGVFFIWEWRAFGRWDRKRNKTIWAFGPIRFFVSRNLGKFKS